VDEPETKMLPASLVPPLGASLAGSVTSTLGSTLAGSVAASVASAVASSLCAALGCVPMLAEMLPLAAPDGAELVPLPPQAAARSSVARAIAPSLVFVSIM
jgi:hypothetical protein